MYKDVLTASVGCYEAEAFIVAPPCNLRSELK
jgi:hypothetical protein